MKFFKYYLVLIVLVVSTTAVGYVAAWTGPTSTPPNANASEPLNVSATSQTKLGSLGAYGLFLTGASPQYINFSSTLGSSGFGIRNNSGIMEYKNSTGAWTAIGAIGQWETSGSNIFYTTGDVAVGASSPEDKLHVSGNILQNNSNTLRAKNNAGTVETWIWPRYSDNVTYVNYGAAGLNVRNNASVSAMFIANNGNVGVGADTTPDYGLELEGSTIQKRTIGINDVPILYLPDQTNFAGSLIVGNGGASLTHNTATQGFWNTALGIGALVSITTGYHNSALGFNTLYTNATGILNTAVGMNALFTNLSGSDNTAVGINSQYINSSGSYNTSLGNYSLFANTGQYNTAVGTYAAYDETTGNYNTIVGYNTGRGITTGSSNTILGANVQGLSTSLSNNIILADGAGNIRTQINGSGNVRLHAYGAGTLTTDASGNVTAASDERLKIIDRPYVRGLESVHKLHPVLYRWNDKSGFDTESLYAGFSAQNVQSVIPEAVSEDPRGYLTLQDRPIIAALVNAVKEQQIQIDILRAQLELLQK